MVPISSLVRLRFTLVLRVLMLHLLVPVIVQAQGILEVPTNNSFQSGKGVISGWNCKASIIEIVADGSIRVQASYGTPRADVQATCGGTLNTGFGFDMNWSNLSDGQHLIQVLADGVEFARATVTVTTFGTNYLRGATGFAFALGFPQPTNTTLLQWQESAQNFVVTASVPNSAFPALRGHYQLSFTEIHTGCTNPAQNGTFSFSGQLSVLTQLGIFFQGTVGALATGGATISSIAGEVFPQGAINGYINTDAYTSDGTYLASGQGIFTGSISGNSLSGTYGGGLIFGETCSVSGSLSGVKQISFP